jgi:hypothetical protein
MFVYAVSLAESSKNETVPESKGLTGKKADDKKAKKIRKLKKGKKKSERKKTNAGKDESLTSCKIDKDCPGKV